MKNNYGVPSTDAFEDSYINYATLHVPTASINVYKAAEPWASFKTIIGLDGTLPDNPEPGVMKCATPTVSFVSGMLKFSCETEDVEYITTVKSLEQGNYQLKEDLELTPTFVISAYAQRDGYVNSDNTVVSLCWIFDSEVRPSADGVIAIHSNPVLVRNSGGTIFVQGSLDDGTTVRIYDMSGLQVASGKFADGMAMVSTPLKGGDTVILRIGDRKMKFFLGSR